MRFNPLIEMLHSDLLLFDINWSVSINRVYINHNYLARSNVDSENNYTDIIYQLLALTGNLAYGRYLMGIWERRLHTMSATICLES